MLTYVAEGKGTENGIAQGMDCHIPVRMSHKAGRAVNPDTSEPHFQAVLQLMDVISLSDSYLHTTCNFHKSTEIILNFVFHTISTLMGIFNMFGEQEHRVFNYKPIYYDQEKEELKQKFGKVDGSIEKDKENGTYVPGSYIKGSLRDGHYQRSRSHSTKAQNIIGLIGLLLIVAVLFYIAKFYTIL